MYKKTGLGFTILALFLGGCIWLLEATREQFPLGMDLRGGTELIYELDLSQVKDDPDAVAEEVKDIMSRRLNAFGLKELSIAVQGGDRLVVQLPGGDADAVRRLKEQIERAGRLWFQIVEDGDFHARNMERYRTEEREYRQKRAEWIKRQRSYEERKAANPSLDEPEPREPAAPEYIVRNLERKAAAGADPTYEPLVLKNDEKSKVSGEHIETVYFTNDESFRPAVGFGMKGEGASLLGDLTGSNIKRQMAIVLDDIVVSAPTIQSRISTQGQITGDFTNEDVQDLITVLRGGSLRAKPRLLSESSVGSVLGHESIKAGIQAVLLGLILVMIFIAIYYMAGGLIANFAVIFNIIVVLAYATTFQQDLTLPGIAGILLTIGMAVDANILIFERVREERRRGKGLIQALTNGYQRAFSVIFDSNLTTVITGIVLFHFGSGPIKGFAVTLIAGIVVSFVSSLFVTKLLLSFCVNKGLIKQLRMMQAFETPNIQFTKAQRPFFIASGIALVLTWALVFARGSANYGIDFTGGARLRMRLAEAVERSVVEDHVRELAKASPELFPDWSIQTIGEPEADTIKYREFALLTRAGAAGAPVKVAEAQGATEDEAASDDAAASDGGRRVTDAAQLVRTAIEARVGSLLLPHAFPHDPTWAAATTGIGESMALDVNLIDVDSQVTVDWIQKSLAEHFGDPTDEKNKYRSLQVESVTLQETNAATGVATYRIALAPFQPLEVPEASGPPTREETLSLVRSFLQEPPAFGPDGAQPFSLSEPFPQVTTVGKRVSSDLQTEAIVAVFISILGIVFYVSLRFEFMFAVGAIIALLHDVLMCIGFMAVADWISENFLGGAFPIKLNLPELAALLTTIGYSINDTIVIFDRVRENMQAFAKKGMSLRECVDLSINQTLTRTLWTTFTTFLTVAALLLFGGDSIRGFAYIFMIGLIAGTYSTVFIASPVVIWFHDRYEARKAALATQTA